MNVKRCSIFLILFILLACIPSIVHAADSVVTISQRADLYADVAKRGRAATVGVYCEVSKNDSYYGTGVLISADGYILTSTTVVPDGAKDIKVYLHDHTHLDAVVIASSAKAEAALLKVEGQGLPFLPVSFSVPVVGQRAYTFGNANNMIRLGEGASFSVGVISGLYEVESADNQSSYVGLAIETDASINPGQDGGPLLNAYGQVTGIISLSYSNRRQQGTAVPMTVIRDAIPPLADGAITVSTDPLITPLAGDLPDTSPLIQQARKIAPALIRLEVNREYGPEMVQRKNWSEFSREMNAIDEKDEAKRQRMMIEFFQVDQVLGANQVVRRPAGAVTGLVISPDGYILTSAFNVHDQDITFVHRANGYSSPPLVTKITELLRDRSANYAARPNPVTSIQVILPGGEKGRAKIVSWNEPLALALLKVDLPDGEALPYFDLEKMTAAAPTLGTRVAILGINRDNDDFTFNTGIVSAEARNRGRNFQFDAMVNFGNAGGPVIDSEGHVLGIAGAPIKPNPILGRILPFEPTRLDPDTPALHHYIVAPNGGIGIASRTDQLITALAAMRKGETVRNEGGAFLGVASDQTKALGDVVVVGGVLPNSPAHRGGLKKNDVLLSLDGRVLRSWKDLLAAVAEKQPGETVTLKVRRLTGQPYVEINDQKLTSGKTFDALVEKFEAGEPFEGTYVRPQKELSIEITLGERKQ